MRKIELAVAGITLSLALAVPGTPQVSAQSHHNVRPACAPVDPHGKRIGPHTTSPISWLPECTDNMSYDFNWNPRSVPGSTDTAQFDGNCGCGATPVDNLVFSVTEIDFTPGGEAYTIASGGDGTSIATSGAIHDESTTTQQIDATIASAGSVTIDTGAHLVITAASNTSVGLTSVDHRGILDLAGTGHVGDVHLADQARVMNGGTIGTLNSDSGGYLSTENGTININTMGSITNTQDFIEISGVGDEHHSMMNVASGVVDLSHWTLGGKLNYVPTIGDQITILDATDGFGGSHFSGYPDGSTVTSIDGYPFRINYTTIDSTNHDVVLTALKPPPAEFILSATPNPATPGQPVTLTATIESAEGYPTPTGSVDFYDGDTLLGTSDLAGDPHATWLISHISTGSHSFSAVYSGDDNFVTTTSGTIVDTASVPVPEVGAADDDTSLLLVILGAGILRVGRRRRSL